MNHKMVSAQRIFAGMLTILLLLVVVGPVWAAGSTPPPPSIAPAPGPPAGALPSAGAPEGEPIEATPPRISYLNGEVSFWRPGAQDWSPAAINMPLAPGDVLFAGPAGNVEVQIGPRAFVRAAYGAQLGLDNQEPDFVQLRLVAGYAAVDLRELQPGHVVELDTPGAAFTMDRAGYYHAEVGPETTMFRTHRGGTATMTPAGGPPQLVAGNQQATIAGGATPRVELTAAAPLTTWDRWNYQRSDYLIQPASARYMSSTVYGGEALDRYGTWRSVETYGNVWVPSGVPMGWSPYTTGRWIWDARFGWTWLDEAPWGWAPYHYGRWVYVGPYWAWAPGPVVVRPAYAPALVVFLGGPVVVGHPLYWAPLGWGEPVVRWWGPPAFVGVAWWGGWGGPHVVNNVVINRTTTVNVTNVTVYRNVNVTNAVVGVPADRFGQGAVRPTRVAESEVRQLAPVHGAPDVRPVASSFTPVARPGAARPPETLRSQPVVATRAPQDPAPTLRAQGLSEPSTTMPTRQQHIVSAPPRAAAPPPGAASAPPAPGAGAAGRTGPDDGQAPGRGPGMRGHRGGAAGDAYSRHMPAARQAPPPAPPAPGVQGAPLPQSEHPRGEQPSYRGGGERVQERSGRPVGERER